MSEHIFKSHNKSLLLYHFVFPIKYRRDVLTKEVCLRLRVVCFEIENRYEIHFIEMELDGNHGHFLTRSVPVISAKKIANTLKSITAKELLRLHLEIKQKLWGGNFG